MDNKKQEIVVDIDNLKIDNNKYKNLKEQFQEQQKQYEEKQTKKSKIFGITYTINRNPTQKTIIVRILGTISMIYIAITIIMYILTLTGIYPCMAI